MAARRYATVLLILIFLNSAVLAFPSSPGIKVDVERSYNLSPPMPEFSSEAPSLNFTISYPVPRPAPVFGQLRVLIIAVDFNDYNHTLSVEQLTDQTIKRLNDYYSRVSYGATSVTGTIVGWVTLPHKLSSYGMDNGPFVDDQDGDGYPDSWRLLRDAVPIVSGQVNFADYQHVMILHAGYGQESSRVVDDIWSVTYLQWKIQVHQLSLDTFTIVPEFEARGLDTMGVYTHEFGHLLGLPDLYSITTEQVGPWDLMARGAWNGKPAGSCPAEMSSWTRMFLGWIMPAQILNLTGQVKVNATIQPLESPTPGVQTVRVQTSLLDSKRYYLIEVRQQIGFDVSLPSSGVLITYIDETKTAPVKVIDAGQKTSTLEDAPFKVGDKYVDAQTNIVVSVASTDGSGYLVVIDTLAPSPDVVVESLTLTPRNVHPNTTASLTVRIANQGTLKAKSFLVDIHLNDSLFASRKIALNRGEIQQIQLSWTPKTAAAYVFRVVLDPTVTLAESDRGNNEETLRVVVGYTLTLEVRPPNAGDDLEWWLSVNGVNETYVGVGEFQVGVLPGSNTIYIQPAIYQNPDSRYIFRQWSDGSTSNPRVIEVTMDIALSTDYDQQYLLSLSLSGGEASGGGWYDVGAAATVTVTSPSSVMEGQSRLLFVGWSGDVQSNSTTITVIMEHPYNIAANWKTQYYLRILSDYDASGEGWYDADSVAPVSTASPVVAGRGVRHIFVQWSGDLLGSDPNQLVVMSGPKMVSAVWTTEYELTIVSEHGHTTGAGWYAPAAQAAYGVDTPIIDDGSGTRRVFRSWSGDAQGSALQGTIVMDTPKVVQANWGTEYRIVFKTRGVRNETVFAVMIDGQAVKAKVPETISTWREAGSSVSFSVNATFGEGFRRYVFLKWENNTGGVIQSPRIVIEPQTYVAVYNELGMFPCIIATVTFGSELTPEVQLLRGFRDQLVLSTQAGSAFMGVFNMWYYSFSPQVANYIVTHDNTRDPIRIGLYPLIAILGITAATYSALSFSSEFAIVAAGIVASALIGLTYLTPFGVVIARYLSKRKLARQALRWFAASSAAAVLIIATGETTGTFVLLAVGSSSLVLTVLIGTPILFAMTLARVFSVVRSSQRMRDALTTIMRAFAHAELPKKSCAIVTKSS